MSEKTVVALTSSDIYQGLQTIKGVLAPDLSDDELRLFSMVATRSGLDPFARQIFAIKRKGRVTFQTSIDGYRSIAARTGMYDGQDEPEYGPVCACADNRPTGHPEFATVRVHRKGVTRAIAATAFWHEYKPEAGPSGQGDVMWMRMPRVMIAKVAEALALRKAFPYDPERREGIGADVYTADEMAQADGVQAQPPPRPTLAERVAEKRAEIEQPAESVADLLGDAPPIVVGPYPERSLTVEELKAEIARLGVDLQAALARSREMFPRGDTEPLTGVQRAALVADLEALQSAAAL